MIDANCFLRILSQNNVTFYSGVPDALLTEFNFAVSHYSNGIVHQIACNHRAAVSMAIGSYLATGHPPVVYLQKSGLRSIINPICSLIAPKVYGIPLLLIISWQDKEYANEYFIKNKFQHSKGSSVTLPLLETLNIPYQILNEDTDDYEKLIVALLVIAINECRPVALVIRKNIFFRRKIS